MFLFRVKGAKTRDPYERKSKNQRKVLRTLQSHTVSMYVLFDKLIHVKMWRICQICDVIIHSVFLRHVWETAALLDVSLGFNAYIMCLRRFLCFSVFQMKERNVQHYASKKFRSLLHSKSAFNLLECDVAGSYFPSKKKKQLRTSCCPVDTQQKTIYMYFKDML